MKRDSLRGAHDTSPTPYALTLWMIRLRAIFTCGLFTALWMMRVGHDLIRFRGEGKDTQD